MITSQNVSTPAWKRLGYSSYQEYVNATSGANGNKKLVSATVGANNNIFGAAAKTPASIASVKTPSLQTAYGKYINGGGNASAVANEGVIYGNQRANNDTFASPGSTQNTLASIGGSVVSVPTGYTATEQSAQQDAVAKPAARTDEGSYNGETDFLEWYKNNYGTDYNPSVGFSRREGMNDGVWNVGSYLYGLYTQGLKDEESRAVDEENANKYYDEQYAAIGNEYATSRDELEKRKRLSQQNASITLDKLKKYLPTQIKAQGLGGLGVSESTMLQAHNNYNNDMGEIERDYLANKTSLDTGESTAKQTLGQNRTQALQEISDKYGAYARERIGKAGSEGQNIFNAYTSSIKQAQEIAFYNAIDAIEGSTDTSPEALMEYVASLKGKVDDTQYDSLVQHVNSTVNKNADAAANTLFNELMTSIDMGAGEGYNTAYELEGEYDKIKDNLSAEQRAVIERRINALKKNEYQQQSDSEYYQRKFYTADGELMSREKAQEALTKVLNSDASEVEKAQYQAAFDSFYPSPFSAVQKEAGTVPTFEYDGRTYRVNISSPLSDEENKSLTALMTDVAKFYGVEGIANGVTLPRGQGKYATYYNGRWYYSN